MITARSNKALITRRPFKVLISLVTLMAFFNEAIIYGAKRRKLYGRIESRLNKLFSIPWRDISFRVIAAVILIAFISTTVCQDCAWAVGSTTELPGGGPDRAGSSGLFKELRPDTFALPEYLGHVKDSWSSTPRRGQPSNKGLARGEYESLPPVVIHIQDAHCNYYAQKRISEIVEYLNKEYGVDTINLEGGAKGYDLSVFTGIADKNIRDKASDYFVKEGFVNGAEYFAVNNPDKVNLWGIEDVGLYIENLKVYRNSLKHKEEVDRILKSLAYIMSNLKTKIYSKELLDLDRDYTAYKAGNMKFKDYIARLIETARTKAIDIRAFTNLCLLNRTLAQEENIDFKKANNQRDDLIDRLTKQSSKKSLEELVAKTIEFKAEKISQKEFYAYLAARSSLVDIDMRELPELRKYIAYISMYSAIDNIKVVEEVDRLEEAVREALYKNDKERELCRLSKNFAILKNMFNISLTREDYRYYIDNEDAFNASNYTFFINREALLYKIDAKVDESIDSLDSYREEIAEFYKYSLERDKAFLKNIKFSYHPSAFSYQPKAESRKQKVAIIVTGGFHTDSLAELFRKNDISYISIMPNFRDPEGYDCPYFKLLSGAKNTSIRDELPSVLKATLALAQTNFCPLIAKAVNEAGFARPAAAPPAAAPEGAKLPSAGVAPAHARQKFQRYALPCSETDAQVRFDSVANAVRRFMPFTDLGPGLLPGAAVSLDDRLSQMVKDGHPALKESDVRIWRNYANVITHAVKLPKVYYIGLGDSDQAGHRFNLLYPLLATDFDELIGVEVSNLSFREFKNLSISELSRIIDPGTEIEFPAGEQSDQRYVVKFRFLGRERKVTAYFSFDGMKTYPQELEGGYNVLISAVGSYDIEFYNRLFSLLGENAGFMIGRGAELMSADPDEYDPEDRADVNCVYMVVAIREHEFLLKNFTEISSIPFFILGSNAYWDEVQKTHGFPQHRPVLLAKNKTAGILYNKQTAIAAAPAPGKANGPQAPHINLTRSWTLLAVAATATACLSLFAADGSVWTSLIMSLGYFFGILTGIFAASAIAYNILYKILSRTENGKLNINAISEEDLLKIVKEVTAGAKEKEQKRITTTILNARGDKGLTALDNIKGIDENIKKGIAARVFFGKSIPELKRRKLITNGILSVLAAISGATSYVLTRPVREEVSRPLSDRTSEVDPELKEFFINDFISILKFGKADKNLFDSIVEKAERLDKRLSLGLVRVIKSSFEEGATVEKRTDLMDHYVFEHLVPLGLFISIAYSREGLVYGVFSVRKDEEKDYILNDKSVKMVPVDCIFDYNKSIEKFGLLASWHQRHNTTILFNTKALRMARNRTYEAIDKSIKENADNPINKLVISAYHGMREDDVASLLKEDALYHELIHATVPIPDNLPRNNRYLDKAIKFIDKKQDPVELKADFIGEMLAYSGQLAHAGKTKATLSELITALKQTAYNSAFDIVADTSNLALMTIFYQISDDLGFALKEGDDEFTARLRFLASRADAEIQSAAKKFFKDLSGRDIPKFEIKDIMPKASVPVSPPAAAPEQKLQRPVAIKGVKKIVTALMFAVGLLLTNRTLAQEAPPPPTSSETEKKIQDEIKILISDLASSEKRIKAAQRLVELGKPAVKPLIEALHNGSKEVSLGVLEMIGRLKDQEAMRAVIETLAHPDKEKYSDKQWYKAAVGAMNDFDRLATPDLIKALKETSDPIGINHLVAVIKDLSDPQSIDILYEIFKKKKGNFLTRDHDVPMALLLVIEASLKQGQAHPLAYDIIFEILSSPSREEDQEIGYEAVLLAGELIVKYPNPQLKDKLLQFVNSSYDILKGDPLFASKFSRAAFACLRALVIMGDERVDQLGIDLLDKSKGDTQCIIAEFLAKEAKKEAQRKAVEVLKSFMKTGTVLQKVKSAAILLDDDIREVDALWRQNYKKAEKILVDVINAAAMNDKGTHDPELVRIAIEGLSNSSVSFEGHTLHNYFGRKAQPEEYGYIIAALAKMMHRGSLDAKFFLSSVLGVWGEWGWTADFKWDSATSLKVINIMDSSEGMVDRAIAYLKEGASPRNIDVKDKEKKVEKLMNLLSKAKELGILFPFRFIKASKGGINEMPDYSLLGEIIQNRLTRPAKNERVAKVIYPRTDWNGAFGTANPVISSLIKYDYKVVYFEAGSKEDVLRIMREEMNGAESSDIVVLGGHSSERAISVGGADPAQEIVNDKLELTVDDAEAIKKTGFASSIRKHLILVCCSAGKGRENGNNLINMFRLIISNKLVHIWGATAPAGPSEIIFDINGNLIEVKFMDEKGNDSTYQVDALKKLLESLKSQKETLIRELTALNRQGASSLKEAHVRMAEKRLAKVRFGIKRAERKLASAELRIRSREEQLVRDEKAYAAWLRSLAMANGQIAATAPQAPGPGPAKAVLFPGITMDIAYYLTSVIDFVMRRITKPEVAEPDYKKQEDRYESIYQKVHWSLENVVMPYLEEWAMLTIATNEHLLNMNIFYYILMRTAFVAWHYFINKKLLTEKEKYEQLPDGKWKRLFMPRNEKIFNTTFIPACISFVAFISFVFTSPPAGMLSWGFWIPIIGHMAFNIATPWLNKMPWLDKFIGMKMNMTKAVVAGAGPATPAPDAAPQPEPPATATPLATGIKPPATPPAGAGDEELKNVIGFVSKVGPGSSEALDSLDEFFEKEGVDRLLDVVESIYYSNEDPAMRKGLINTMRRILATDVRRSSGIFERHVKFFVDIAIESARKVIRGVIEEANASLSGKVIMYQNLRLGAMYPAMESDMLALLRANGYPVMEIKLDDILSEKGGINGIKRYIQLREAEFDEAKIILVRFKISSAPFPAAGSHPENFMSFDQQLVRVKALLALSRLPKALGKPDSINIPILMVDASEAYLSDAQRIVHRKFPSIKTLNPEGIGPAKAGINFVGIDDADDILPASSPGDTRLGESGPLYQAFAREMASALSKDRGFWAKFNLPASGEGRKPSATPPLPNPGAGEDGEAKAKAFLKEKLTGKNVDLDYLTELFYYIIQKHGYVSFMELYIASGENADFLFQRSLLALKKRFPGDRGRKELAFYWPGLVSLGKAVGIEAWTLLDPILPDLDELFEGTLKYYWPGLVKLGAASGEVAPELFRYGMPALKEFFIDSDQLSGHWDDVVNMGTAAKYGAWNLFTKGFPKLKELFPDEDIEWPGVHRLGKEFKHYWPDLVKLGIAAGEGSPDLFESGLPALKKLFPDKQKFKARWPDILSRIINICNSSNEHNRGRLVNLLARQYLPQVKGLSLDLFKTLDFYNEIIGRERRLSLQVLEGLIDGLKKGIVDKDLSDQEKERILSFVKLAHSFSPSLFRLYKNNGAGGLKEVRQFAEKVALDNVDEKELAELEAKLGSAGITKEEMKEAMLGCIQQAVPSSGDSFAKKEEIGGLFNDFRQAGDRRGDIPPALRNKDFGDPSLKKTIEIELEFRVVKGIPYSLWGLNAGVCIYEDLDLWNDPRFMLLAIIDKRINQAVGFVHLFAEEIDGQKILTVPGIEPSVEFLSQVRAKDLYPLIEEALKNVAGAGAYDSLYIPVEPNILSNRSDIKKIVKNRYASSIKSLSKQIKWNTMPERYPFKEVYEVWTRPTAAAPQPEPPAAAAPKTPSIAAGVTEGNEEEKRHNEDASTYIREQMIRMGMAQPTTDERRAWLYNMLERGVGQDRVYRAYSERGSVYRGYTAGIIFIKIPGLFENTGEFGHIGLGRTYGDKVVYIDEEFANDPDCENHELFEIELWENAANIRSLSLAKMREEWMRRNSDEAYELAGRLHNEADEKYPVARLVEKWRRLHPDRPVNISRDGIDELPPREGLSLTVAPIHTDIELARKGLAAMRALMKKLPDLADVIGKDKDLMRVYTGVAPEMHIDHIFTGLDQKQKASLIKGIEEDENFRVVEDRFFNLEAISRAIKANHGYFPPAAVSDPKSWIIKEWPGITSRVDKDEHARMHGLISGYPENVVRNYPFYHSTMSKWHENNSNFKIGEKRDIHEYCGLGYDQVTPGFRNLVQRLLYEKAGYLNPDEINIILDGHGLASAALGGLLVFRDEDKAFVRRLDKLLADIRPEAEDIPAVRNAIADAARSDGGIPLLTPSISAAPKASPADEQKIEPSQLTRLNPGLEERNWYYRDFSPNEKENFKNRLTKSLSGNAPTLIKQLAVEQLKLKHGISLEVSDIKQVLLFGSWCYGDSPADLDIAVIVESDKLKENCLIEGAEINQPERWFTDPSRYVSACDIRFFDRALMEQPQSAKKEAQLLDEARLWGHGISIEGENILTKRPADRTILLDAVRMLLEISIRASYKDENIDLHIDKIISRWKEVVHMIHFILGKDSAGRCSKRIGALDEAISDKNKEAIESSAGALAAEIKILPQYANPSVYGVPTLVPAPEVPSSPVAKPSTDAASLGAMVSSPNARGMVRLRRFVSMLKRSGKNPLLNKDSTDADVIEYALVYIRETCKASYEDIATEDVITFAEGDAGVEIVRIDKAKLIEMDKKLSDTATPAKDYVRNKLARRIRTLVRLIEKITEDKDEGVAAINFLGTDKFLISGGAKIGGINKRWRVVGIIDDLMKPGVLDHEYREIEFRKAGVPWQWAHYLAIKDKDSPKEALKYLEQIKFLMGIMGLSWEAANGLIMSGKADDGVAFMDVLDKQPDQQALREAQNSVIGAATVPSAAPRSGPKSVKAPAASPAQPQGAASSPAEAGKTDKPAASSSAKRTAVSSAQADSANDSLVLELTKGIVLPEFLTPGLLVISDNDAFQKVNDIFEDYGDVFGIYRQGMYLNRGFGENSPDKATRQAYAKAFKYLDKEYGIRLKRVVITRHNSSLENTRHEILHDVIEMISQKHPQVFERLADFMYYHSHIMLKKKQDGFYFAYSYLSRATISIAKRDIRYRHNALKEFIPKFFSGELRLQTADRKLRNAYLYVLNHMPEEAKSLFDKLGFIWPSNEIAAPETRSILPEIAAALAASPAPAARVEQPDLRTIVRKQLDEILSSHESIINANNDGRLDALLPEWKDIKDASQTGPHTLTVGEHTLLAIEVAEKKGYVQQPDRVRFNLIMLLHDLGKKRGFKQGDMDRHCEDSAAKAKIILNRLGYAPGEASKYVWYVKYHDICGWPRFEHDKSPEDWVQQLQSEDDIRMFRAIALADNTSKSPDKTFLTADQRERIDKVSTILTAIVKARAENDREDVARAVERLRKYADELNVLQQSPAQQVTEGQLLSLDDFFIHEVPDHRVFDREKSLDVPNNGGKIISYSHPTLSHFPNIIFFKRNTIELGEDNIIVTNSGYVLSTGQNVLQGCVLVLIQAFVEGRPKAYAAVHLSSIDDFHTIAKWGAATQRKRDEHPISQAFDSLSKLIGPFEYKAMVISAQFGNSVFPGTPNADIVRKGLKDIWNAEIPDECYYLAPPDSSFISVLYNGHDSAEIKDMKYISKNLYRLKKVTHLKYPEGKAGNAFSASLPAASPVVTSETSGIAIVAAESIEARREATKNVLQSEENAARHNPMAIIGLPWWMAEEMKDKAGETPEAYLASFETNISRLIGERGFGGRTNPRKFKLFFIEKDSNATKINLQKTLDAVQIKDGQEVVIFAPQIDGSLIKIDEHYLEKFGKQCTVIQDAYSDTDISNSKGYPDVGARITITRLITWCKEAKNDDARKPALEILTNYISYLTGVTISSVNDLKGLLDQIKLLRIRPVDYKDIIIWHDSHKALATAA